VPVANVLHDLQDRLSDVFTAGRSPELAGAMAATRSHPGWPIEPADLFVIDPRRPLAVSTLGDPDLARSVMRAGHLAVGVAGPTATENIGVEKIVRNVLAAPGIQVLILAGPETGGTAPTGHYAGDALCALHERGVDPETMRIRGARGRRPFVKNLAPAEVTAFQRQVRLVDLRGEVDLVAVLAAVDAVVASLPAGTAGPGVATSDGPIPATADVFRIRAESTTGYRPDPIGYVLVFADHVAGLLILEHYDADHRRTAVVTGLDPAAVARTAVERGLVGTLDHACYLGRELQRAAQALACGTPYVQD
jgi:tetrahydromethanopterin S-methyltransferase subunit A